MGALLGSVRHRCFGQTSETLMRLVRDVALACIEGTKGGRLHAAGSITVSTPLLHCFVLGSFSRAYVLARQRHAAPSSLTANSLQLFADDMATAQRQQQSSSHMEQSLQQRQRFQAGVQLGSDRHPNGEVVSGSSSAVDDRSKPAIDQGWSHTTLAKGKAWYKRQNVTLELVNKGSVARDHLANERTVLAWLRSSLSLASIGVAVTQLFRLSTILENGSSGSANAPSSAVAQSALAHVQSLLFIPAEAQPDASLMARQGSSDTDATEQMLLSAVRALTNVVIAQQVEIDSMITSQASEKLRYRRLGKPIGGTFLLLALVFLALGFHRYFAVQEALTRDMYVPARRSVIFSSFVVGALTAAAFASILAIA
ncbi:uncharacterized protein L969DRAFT_94298 [Mixia osmundae IAM 14324]|uniref:DUF202 domain-containing protein n=1 Tax=Mixia osmundae (strain CBS 9802 / IAM 14324 / JCM 22182 / KY 12970) TaxID=764103 RepID=G7E8G0_MIXOS|nr:uncharacterized protein L969DRAFT_94298 [Mixia osmundae IAM 14324]KEI39221.1 hypothetical protein L969DRAFT_94298 [Mixia osmundae IAM 14324]GAA99120.1 hypothetical protein E5Q_05810 [Mixia osmundae IAM 14324]